MKPNQTIRRITSHSGWDGYMQQEREQLAQRAEGKMARMIGRTLPGEDQEHLDLIISDDEFMAQNGYAPLRQGNKVWQVHIDELTRENSWARLEYEKTLVMWLKGRIEGEKITAPLRKNSRI
jgi:hypothetical protein